MRAEAQLRVARVALLAGDPEAAAEAARHAVEALPTAAAHGLGRALRRGGGRGPSAGRDGDPRRPPGRHVGQPPGSERLGMTVEAVDAHLAAGRTAALLGRDGWAEAELRARARAGRGSSMLTRLRGRLGAASAATLRDEPTVAVRHCRQGLADLDRHRGHWPRPSSACSPPPTASSWPAGAPGVAGDLVAGEGLRLDGAQPGDRPPVGAAHRRGRLRRGVRAPARDEGGDPGHGGASDALEARAHRARATAPPPDLGDARRTGRPGTADPDGELQALLGDRVLVEYGVLDGEVFAAVVTAGRCR